MNEIDELLSADNIESSGAEAVASVLWRLMQAHSGCSFEDQESRLLSITNEAVRLVCQRRLQKESDELPETVVVGTDQYRRFRPGNVIYHSLVGPLRVRRFTYRLVGKRNGPTVVPLELGAQIVNRATPALTYRIVLGYAQGPMRECEKSMRASHRCPPSRSTMERIAKAVGTEVHQSVKELEEHIRVSEEVPPEAIAMTIGIDRTTIPMEEDREPGAAPTTCRKKRRKPYVRSPRPLVDVRYRMAYVGTVAFVDCDGETVQSRKYAVPAHEGGHGVVERLFADVLRARAERPDLTLGIIQDGAPELWGLMWNALDQHDMRRDFYQLIDRYHVSERLAEAAELLSKDEQEKASLLNRWETKLDRHDNAMERIHEELEQRVLLTKLPANKKRRLEGHLTYLFPHRRFRYASIARQGLPIGSGVTEGACKSLIEARTKRSGQRWRKPGVTAVLTLRSLNESGRLKTAWRLFKPFYGEEICAAA